MGNDTGDPMKDVKITIAKGVLIFVVLLVVVEIILAVTITMGWDISDIVLDVISVSVCFCGWCLLAFFIIAMAARKFARAIMLGVLWCVYAAFFYQWVWAPFASSRLWILILLLASACFGAVLAYCKPFPGQGTLQKVIVIFAALMGLPACGMTALSIAFSPVDVVKQTAISPDGRYQAVRIDRNDTDSTDYDLVYIKPHYFYVLNILDYPSTEIIQLTDGESLTGVRWANPHTLVVEEYPGTSFAQQDKSWRDVKIVYKNEGQSPKE